MTKSVRKLGQCPCCGSRTLDGFCINCDYFQWWDEKDGE